MERISRDNLEVNIKDIIYALQNKQLINDMISNPPNDELDKIVKVLKLCCDLLKDGIQNTWSENGGYGIMMINQENLEVSIKELLRDLENKQHMNYLTRIADYQLNTIVDVLVLCLERVQSGTYEDGYEDGYNCCISEDIKDSYDEGWSDCKQEVISILRNYGVTTKDVPDLGDL